ncbi:MAG: hypothetical protein N4A35_03320 [Flavobacteriales bacterium]|jgi:hypothetical protein|nr:hypothetical protein [Flavobacteriales bacterium]
MNKSEALLYLEAEEDNWQEVLALKLFELKKELFQRIVIPKIYAKRAEKVALWYEAECILLGEHPKEIENSTFTFEPLNEAQLTSEALLQLYRTFETRYTTLQLELSQAFKAKEIAEKLNEIAQLELERQKTILPIAARWIVTPLTSITVKMTDAVNTGVIISELNQLDQEALLKKDLHLLPNFKKDLERTLKSNK